MHYYQFNIGDYIKNTLHLSLMEDLAYRRLLDLYYDSEQPIPNDIPRLARRLRLESQVVQIVLDEFFTLTDEGYKNHRADLEIASYHEYMAKQKANGSKGGRPKRTQEKPTGNPDLTQNHPKQEPLTINQEPLDIAPSVLVKTDKPVVDRIPCPADEILRLYHAQCQSLPRAMMLNGNRRKHLVSRWREVYATDKFADKSEGIEIFKSFFERVNNSDFLCGRTQNKNGRVWKASLDWLILPTNFLKVVEGHYDNGR
jgi:uncharacterized protein YdaU (DUF1376 family)